MRLKDKFGTGRNGRPVPERGEKMFTEAAKKECERLGLESIKVVSWHDMHFGAFTLCDVNPQKGYRFEYPRDKRVKFWISAEEYGQLQVERDFKTGLSKHLK